MIKLRVDDETAIPLSVDSSSAVSMTVSEAFIDRGGAAIQNNKNAAPSTSQVVVTPDEGFDGMAKVTVAAMPQGTLDTIDINFDTSTGHFTASAGVATSGYIADTASVGGGFQLDTQAAATITPSTVQRQAVAAHKYTTGAVNVGPIPSEYIVPTGTKSISANGTGIDVKAYEKVDVAVPGITPSGTLAIATNGSHDVTNYATANVAVPASAVDTGTKNITANGNGQDVIGYAAVDVNVPGIVPAGTKQINQNGTHDVAQYASAEVNVPNTYSASDEGKVVSSGALVAQTSQTIDENGTYDTTLKNEVVVDVQSGGGLTLESALDGVIAGTITTYENPTITTIPDSMFRANMWNTITSFTAHNVTTIQNYGMSAIGAKNVAFPNVTGINVGFISNGKVEKLDLGSGLYNLSANAFNSANALDTLILRRSSSLVTMSNANAFNNSHFKSGGTGGTIYIPKVLYDHLGDGSNLDYKAATNWTTVNGYGTITWAKIEGSFYETQYADGTPIT